MEFFVADTKWSEDDGDYGECLLIDVDGSNITLYKLKGHFEYSQDEDGSTCSDFVEDERKEVFSGIKTNFDAKEILKFLAYQPEGV